MPYFMMRPCRTAAGFVAQPRRQTRLDLKTSGQALRNAGFNVKDVDVLLMIRNEPEATLYKSGKVLVKTHDEAKARAAVEAIYRTLGVGP